MYNMSLFEELSGMGVLMLIVSTIFGALAVAVSFIMAPVLQQLWNLNLVAAIPAVESIGYFQDLGLTLLMFFPGYATLMFICGLIVIYHVVKNY